MIAGEEIRLFALRIIYRDNCLTDHLACLSLLYVVVIITVRLLEPGHLEEDYPITTVFENKRFSTFFEGCFLRGQVSSNGFKVFNGCIDES